MNRTTSQLFVADKRMQPTLLKYLQNRLQGGELCALSGHCVVSVSVSWFQGMAGRCDVNRRRRRIFDVSDITQLGEDVPGKLARYFLGDDVGCGQGCGLLGRAEEEARESLGRIVRKLRSPRSCILARGL